MADVNITKSKSITIRGGVTPSNPVIPTTPEDPVTIPPTPPHNNLSGLQGGTSTERNHIDKDQWDAIEGANAPDAGNPFATMADVGGGGMPPIDGSYASQAAMIADQASQTAQYIYFDGTSYWEYLGTTTPSIADYRQISGGGSDTNKVSYNVADGKTASEQLQARNNIGSTSSTPQVISTSGAINDLSITAIYLVFTGSTVVLSGIVAGLNGQEITILNANAISLSILSQSGLSSLSNRIVGDAIVPQYSIIRLKYTTNANRWAFESISINDSRYLRKDIADSSNGLKTFNQTLANSTVVINSFGGSASHLPLTVNAGDGGIPGLQITGQGRSKMRFLTIASFLGDAVYIRNAADSATTVIITSAGIITHTRSNGATASVRRDELPYNYPETVATAGTINNLSLTNEGIKLLILTAATDLTGVVPVSTTTGRLLRIEGRNAGGVIIRHESASSTAANRFTLPGAVDLTIANGEVYTFIYTNGRWRRAL